MEEVQKEEEGVFMNREEEGFRSKTEVLWDADKKGGEIRRMSSEEMTLRWCKEQKGFCGDE